MFMPKKKGWLMASLAVSRFSGSYSKRCSTRLKKSSCVSPFPRLYFCKKLNKILLYKNVIITFFLIKHEENKGGCCCVAV